MSPSLTPVNLPSSTLFAHIRANADMDSLIAIIPPNFYFPPDPDEVAKKFQKYTGKAPNAPKHERKLNAIERKKARLDPEQRNTVEQIKADGDEGDDDVDEEDEESGDEDEEGSDDEVPGEEKGAARSSGKPSQQQQQSQPSGRQHPTLDAAGRLEGADSRPVSVGGLRQRLAERLAQLRGARGGTAKAPGERAAEAKAKGKQPKHVAGGQNKVRGDGTEVASGGAGAPAVGRSSSSIEFNKIAAAAGKSGKGKRKLSTAELLAQAEEAERKRRARLSAPDGGGEDAQIAEWERALQKAGGVKQKDNPKLLRKALKKKERSKKKSARDWASRLKTVAKGMQERQQKRRENLAERKTKNKQRSNKHKAARAGFEGKKNSFL